MKNANRLTGSTPYYDRFFVMIDETPAAYVSAFREAQYLAQHKRVQGKLAFWATTLLSTVAWLLGFLPLLVVPLLIVIAWIVVGLRNRHEAILLARTFEMALMGKDQDFQEHMWRHLDRRMLSQDF
jgi:hypothetical protein